MLYRIFQKKSEQNFLYNRTIQIRIFWSFRCREQVSPFQNTNVTKPASTNKEVSVILHYVK